MIKSMISGRWALPALAVALGLVLAAELLWPGPAVTIRHTPPTIPAAAPGGPTDAQIAQWVRTALARPLFNASRRPALVAGGAAEPALPRLSAIVITAAGRSAIFGGGATPQVVRPGGEIEGYRVEAISPDAVKLSGPAGVLTLHPQFTGAAATRDGPDGDTSAAPGNAPPAASAGNENRLDDDPI